VGDLRSPSPPAAGALRSLSLRAVVSLRSPSSLGDGNLPSLPSRAIGALRSPSPPAADALRPLESRRSDFGDGAGWSARECVSTAPAIRAPLRYREQTAQASPNAQVHDREIMARANRRMFLEKNCGRIWGAPAASGCVMVRTARHSTKSWRRLCPTPDLSASN